MFTVGIMLLPPFLFYFLFSIRHFEISLEVRQSGFSWLKYIPEKSVSSESQGMAQWGALELQLFHN